MADTQEFRALGRRIEGALSSADLETFPVKDSVRLVKFETKELTAFCPVTHQPDLYEAFIEFVPEGNTVESKTLKLYLNHFRDKGIFGEDLATVICDDLYEVVRPSQIRVTLVQQVRGGLVLTAVAERSKDVG